MPACLHTRLPVRRPFAEPTLPPPNPTLPTFFLPACDPFPAFALRFILTKPTASPWQLLALMLAADCPNCPLVLISLLYTGSSLHARRHPGNAGGGRHMTRHRRGFGNLHTEHKRKYSSLAKVQLGGRCWEAA